MLTFIKSFNVHPSTSGADNSPNAVDWTNIEWLIADSLGSITSKQITGISSSINLYIQEPVSLPEVTLWYQVTNSQITGNITTTPSSPWQQISSSGTTFSVNNNQWVSFCCHGTEDVKDPQTITVVNSSNSNATLDTFTIDVQP